MTTPPVGDLERALRELADNAEPYWPEGYPFRVIDIIRAAAVAALDAVQAIVDREVHSGSVYGMQRIAAMADRIAALKHALEKP